jgi:cell division protein FtsI (penicillin-binding protein 3)
MAIGARTARKKISANGATARVYVVAAVLLTGALLVLGRVAQQQIMSGEEGKDFLQAQGKARSLREEPMLALRGMITDRHGDPLAVSTPVTTLWADPKILRTETRPLSVLAKALGLNEKEIKSRANSGKGFVYLKRQISPMEAEKIMALDYNGVYAQREYRRFYPAGEVAAHVVGFTGLDEQGQEGIELAYNEMLQGQMGSKRVLKDLSGRVIKDVQLIKTPQSGSDVRLSLDLRIQYMAHQSLKEAIKEHDAKAGSVVVLDSQTGEVLAMANHPSYNPNNRQQLSGGQLRNRAVTDVFEPGSTVKPLAMIAALESGKYRPSTLIDTHPGSVRVAGKVFSDKNNLGVIDLATVIAKSSQVGTTKIAMDLPGNDIRNALYRMGFGQPTGSGFPGESIGVFPPTHTRWRPVEQATMAFGHGLSATPLQVARAYMVLANDGVRRKVTLLHQMPAQASSVLSDQHQETVLSAQVSRQILDMMKLVTQSGGTATRANVSAYTVAGKTGTAHKAIAGGYAADRYTSLFAGMAPATSPRFVIVVMIDEPSGKKYYGGEVAAPVFSQVMTGALRLYSVPPDDFSVVTKQRLDQAKEKKVST